MVVVGRSLAAVVDVGTGSVVVEPTLLLLVLLLCLATFRFLSFPFSVFFNPDNMFTYNYFEDEDNEDAQKEEEIVLDFSIHDSHVPLEQ